MTVTGDSDTIEITLVFVTDWYWADAPAADPLYSSRCVLEPKWLEPFNAEFVLHYITLHSIPSHYITVRYITLRYITLHYVTLLHYITLH